MLFLGGVVAALSMRAKYRNRLFGICPITVHSSRGGILYPPVTAHRASHKTGRPMSTPAEALGAGEAASGDAESPSRNPAERRPNRV